MLPHRHRSFDHRAMALLTEMPRHDARIVLHDRAHAPLALADIWLALGVELGWIGEVAGEDDFLTGRALYVLRHLRLRVPS